MFTGKLLFAGFGSIGQAVAPALLNHWKLPPSRVRALAADQDGAAVALALGIEFDVQPIHEGNLGEVLASRLNVGDLLVNVSVQVSSKALIEWCQAHGVLYLDTCVEPWEGGYLPDDGRTLAGTTNYALREDVLALRGAGRPTAVIAHGANPGLISHLAKAGLLDMANEQGLSLPEGPHAWARLCQSLGVKVIHIAERDTQQAEGAHGGAFVNTWSAEGLLAEAWQCAELGWGTHEKSLPHDAIQHTYGNQAGIFLDTHSVAVSVQSWVPNGGPQKAYLITHHEALSLAEFLTVPGDVRFGSELPAYRPTVYYAYAPCEATRLGLDAWADSGFGSPSEKRVLRDELVTGHDQLGVLFVFDGGAFWYGSTVQLEHARTVAPFNNATSLQVVAGILGALDWMLKHPLAGVVEAEDLPHEEVLEVAKPYMGLVHGSWTDWQPEHRGRLIAPGDLLQFSTFRH
ncbi:saccharopine dehydrogenase NADP-binding domain-containing protein [Paraburkholderia sp. EG287A]|uniref:saccharopine dehydrogenase NADP-binding domain-containing protein n=1 Tax=Paraburkholderia sp. EG287A TaxID=3237012 RepID=UPI0034D277F3